MRTLLECFLFFLVWINLVVHGNCWGVVETPAQQQATPIWFHPSSSTTTTAKKNSASTVHRTNDNLSHASSASTSSCVVFLHGRLEAEPGDDAPFPRPAVLYRDFCHGLAHVLQQPVLMVEYHHLLASTTRFLGREPRSWELGPLSRSIFRTIVHELSGNNGNSHNDDSATNDCATVVPFSNMILVTFSMGAAMGLKFLHHAPTVLPPGIKISHVVLVEPVWRCWLSLVVRTPSTLWTSDDDDSNNDAPAVWALWGTHDSETLTDSGRNVAAALRPLLPHVVTHSIPGANHWYILNHDIAFARTGLPDNKNGLSTDILQRKALQLIADACLDQDGQQ